MRFILRLLSLAALIIAVVAGVIDAIQSVAASGLVLTPLADAWADVSPQTLGGAEMLMTTYLSRAAWDGGAAWLLAQPAFAVFLALSFLLYVIGYRRKAPAGRFSAR